MMSGHKRSVPDAVFVVRYEGPFGFIRPWTAVRDEEVYSQQFLTPSIVEGIRKFLGVSAILRHRLSHVGFAFGIETVHSPGFKKRGRGPDALYARNTGILRRGMLLSPRLHLAFPTRKDGETACAHHISLCRVEDLLFPSEGVGEMSVGEFDAIPGIELLFGEHEDAFPVGYERYGMGMSYGRIHVVGDAVRHEDEG